MADPNKNKRKLFIEECRPVHSGTNKKGRDYTIYQVTASREDRSPLPTQGGEPMKLRSFEAFPVGQVVEVHIEPFRSEQYGDSYTLKSLGGSNGGGASTQSLNEVHERIDELTERIAKLWEKVAALEGQRAVAPASPVAAAPAPVSAELASDDDVPF